MDLEKKNRLDLLECIKSLLLKVFINHNTSLVKELYKDYNIDVIEAKRNINSNGKKRGYVEEVIIINY